MTANDGDAIMTLLRQLLELGWPAIVLLFISILWRRMIAIEKELHDCLREDDTEIPRKTGE